MSVALRFTHMSAGDDVTRALLEAAIEIEQKKLAKTSDPELRNRSRSRIEGIKKLLDELFPEPEPHPLSKQELDELFTRLRDIAERGGSRDPG